MLIILMLDLTKVMILFTSCHMCLTDTVTLGQKIFKRPGPESQVVFYGTINRLYTGRPCSAGYEMGIRNTRFFLFVI